MGDSVTVAFAPGASKNQLPKATEPSALQMFAAAESLAKFIPEIGKRKDYSDGITNMRNKNMSMEKVKEFVMNFIGDMLRGVKTEEQWEKLTKSLEEINLFYTEIKNWQLIVNPESHYFIVRNKISGETITGNIDNKNDVARLRTFIGNDDIFNQFIKWAQAEIAKYAATTKKSKPKDATAMSKEAITQESIRNKIQKNWEFARDEAEKHEQKTPGTEFVDNLTKSARQPKNGFFT
ncbi:MAG: hypothetical protein QW568_00275 [Candidatus Anstonellaceae archaeon]